MRATGPALGLVFATIVSGADFARAEMPSVAEGERAIAIRVEPMKGSEIRAQLIELLEVACGEIARVLPLPRGSWWIEIAQADTIDAFVARTGRARFEAAATIGRTLVLQPDSVLGRQGDLTGILRHECVHLALRTNALPPLPVVLEESLAVGLSGQSAKLAPGRTLSTVELTRARTTLERPSDRRTFETAVTDVVSTIWPHLRDVEPQRLLDYLHRVAVRERSEGATSVLEALEAPLGAWMSLSIPGRTDKRSLMDRLAAERTR